MSQYFRAGEVVLWNPSNRVAELFVRGVGTVAPLVTVPPGIASGRPDEHEVDPDVFAAFVDALVELAGAPARGMPR